MDRYKISNDAVKKALKFLKTGTGNKPNWASKYKDDLTVKGSKLFYKDREVIGKERVDEVLRKELYKKKGDVPSGRDSGFHILKKRYCGISRRALMSFIRAQKPLGEVKAALPKPKWFPLVAWYKRLPFGIVYFNIFLFVPTRNQFVACSLMNLVERVV